MYKLSTFIIAQETIKLYKIATTFAPFLHKTPILCKKRPKNGVKIIFITLFIVFERDLISKT